MTTTSKTPSKSAAKTKVDAPSAKPMSKVDTSKVPMATSTAPSVVEKLSPVVMSNEVHLSGIQLEVLSELRCEAPQTGHAQL